MLWMLSDKKEVEKNVALIPMAHFGAIQEFEPQRWECGAKKCTGFVYDPARMGGAAFEELGPKWKCPSCGAKKSKFKKTEKRVLD